jgi:predicted DNA-binding transcriptional regulator YafY
MPERDTAERQLARLLHLLPAATRDGGVPLDDLVDRLGVEHAQILDDVTLLTERSLLLPAGAGDDLQVLLEAGRLQIWTKGEFRRPVRLTPLEALCVALGLRGLGPDEAREALLTRLESRLALAGVETLRRRVEAADLAPDPSGIRGAVSEALRSRTPCRFGYLKPGGAAPEVRRLEPWALVHAEGRWYAVGRDPEADGPRAFRLDRMLAVELRGDPYRIPDDVDPRSFLEGARLFFHADEERTGWAVVRYSPAVTRWIRERWSGEAEDDGGYRVRHPLADPGWIVRHVLQYGPDAELVDPPELRAVICDTARRMAGRGVSARPDRT